MRRKTHRAIGVAVLALSMSLQGPARADVQGLMNDMFNSMSNTTPPGYWESTRRGVLSGGSFQMRNKITNEQLISFVPPSFSAGCGGIDFFGGAFSFINAAQFTQLMRNVASNAAGYAFQLALDSMCPTCMSVIETLQKKLQELAQFGSNSCQLAQGLVNDTLGAALGKRRSNASLIGMVKGTASDMFDAITETSGTDPETRVSDNHPDEEKKQITGNLVWRALKNNGIGSWFRLSNGAAMSDASGNLFNEVLMNLTGTIIIPPQSASSDSTTSDPKQTHTTVWMPSNRLKVTDLMNGGTFSIQVCDTYDADGCLSPNGSQNVTIKGFYQLTQETLFGTATSTGLVDNLRNPGYTPSAADQAFLSAQSGSLGSQLVNISRRSGRAAEELARAMAPHMALEMARVLITDMMKGVRDGSLATDDPNAADLMKVFSEAQRDIDAELSQLRMRYGSETQILQYYAGLQGLIERIDLAVKGP